MMFPLLLCVLVGAPCAATTPDKDHGWTARLLAAYEDDYFLRIWEMYSGKVIAMSQDTITVQWPGRIPRTFPVAPTLCSDRIPLKWRLGIGHRLRDVRLGDTLTLDVARGRDEYVCIAIGIYRRPGGIIPPAEDDHLPYGFRLHQRRNAEQFFEDVWYPALRAATVFPQLFAER